MPIILVRVKRRKLELQEQEMVVNVSAYMRGAVLPHLFLKVFLPPTRKDVDIQFHALYAKQLKPSRDWEATSYQMKTKLYYLMMCLSLALGTVSFTSCSSDDDDDSTTGEVTSPSDWGSIDSNGYAGTGTAVNICPAAATIQCSINKDYGTAYSSIGVEISKSSSFYDSEIRNSDSGIIEGNHYTVNVESLEPQTTYYYRSSVTCGAANYKGDTRTFTTSSLTIATSGTVTLAGNQWAACNAGAAKPEDAGTLFDTGALEGTTSTYDNYLDYYEAYNYSGNSKFDQITKQLGSGWRTPTNDDWYRLMEDCIVKFTTYNGVKGLVVYDKQTGKNAIFLPYHNTNISQNLCVAQSPGFELYAVADDDYVRDVIDMGEIGALIRVAQADGDTNALQKLAREMGDRAGYCGGLALWIQENGQFGIDWVGTFVPGSSTSINRVEYRGKGHGKHLGRAIKK